MPAAKDYPTGAVKQNARTLVVAVKLPEGSPLGDWGFMSLSTGGGFISNAEVEGWSDLGPM